MHYTVTVDIDKPLDEVVKLFDNPDNLKKWMDGLQKHQVIEGSPGKVGCKTKLWFKMGKREMVMIETLKIYQLPEELVTTYETKGVLNIQKTWFEVLTENKTRYYSENQFKMQGWLKIMGFLMPGAFKKQTLQYMRKFKAFAEAQ